MDDEIKTGATMAPETSEGDAQERSLPSPGADQEGREFFAEACLFVRFNGTKVEGLVQYEGDQYVENPKNPEGDAIPDMNNPAVHFARWLEIHLPALIQLSMGEYHLNQKIAGVAASKKRPVVQLVASDGSKLVQ